MLILKHLKTFQHVSIIIQIIFRELVGSLLKSLNLKILKCKRSIAVMWQHNVWCVCVAFSVGRYAAAYTHTHTHTHTERHAHTPNIMLPHHRK